MAAGGGPCIPLASRILKYRSSGKELPELIPTCFMAESKFLTMKHVGILALAVPCHGLERSFRILLASGIQGPPQAAILPSNSTRAAELSLVPRLSVLRAQYLRMTFDPTAEIFLPWGQRSCVNILRAYGRRKDGEPGDEAS